MPSVYSDLTAEFHYKDLLTWQNMDKLAENDSYVINSYVSPWVAFTPTGAWTTNVTYTGLWRRVGDSMDVQFKIALSGVPDNVAPTIVLPNSKTIDTAKVIVIGNDSLLLGSIRADDDSAGGKYICEPVYFNTTTIKMRFLKHDTPNIISDLMDDNTKPFIFTTDDKLYGFFRVPISGWTPGAAS